MIQLLLTLLPGAAADEPAPLIPTTTRIQLWAPRAPARWGFDLDTNLRLARLYQFDDRAVLSLALQWVERPRCPDMPQIGVADVVLDAAPTSVGPLDVRASLVVYDTDVAPFAVAGLLEIAEAGPEVVAGTLLLAGTDQGPTAAHLGGVFRAEVVDCRTP